MKKIIILFCVFCSIPSYAKIVILTGVMNQPASHVGVFYTIDGKYYCFGDCNDDRLGFEKMIDVLTSSGCSDGLPLSSSSDKDCTIKANIKGNTNIITKVISAKHNIN